MKNVYCVFQQLAPDNEMLIEIFETEEKASAYIRDCNDNTGANYYYEEFEVI